MNGGKIIAGWTALAGAVTLLAGLFGPQTQPARAQATEMFAYVGSFTTAKRKARGDGIHVYRVDRATGAWTHVQHVGDLDNPSFLALSPDQRFLYSVHGDGDYATAFALDRATGQAKVLNKGATA